MNADLQRHIARRAKESMVAARSFDIWLGTLTPVNVLLVGGAGILSLVAGAEILVQTGLFSVQTAGVLAVMSAGLTLIHNRLQCDPHQAECRRLRNEYNSLATKYQSLAVETDPEVLRSKISEFDSNLAQLKAGATASPARWCERKAEREVQPDANE